MKVLKIRHSLQQESLSANNSYSKAACRLFLYISISPSPGIITVGCLMTLGCCVPCCPLLQFPCILVIIMPAARVAMFS